MRLLIVGELNGQIGAASQIARNRGAKVSQVPNVMDALDALRSGNGADLVMVDVREDIRGFVEHLRRERINVPVVACGIHSDSKAAADAIRSGAKEYIPLPPEEALIAAVLEAITAEANAVIHASSAIAKILEVCDQIARSDASILITGESGTGKEVIARYIHRKSRRSGQAFISVNCAAIPEALLESELFGYEKGAFTGAAARRIGKFEEANNGTLLLDEISEMDPRLQAKLLRALQEHEIDRIGGSKPVKVNIRVIATSNRNMQQEVQNGNFREDLYFRLNVIHLNLPPLRERLDDLAPLSAYFIEKYSKANGLPNRPLAADALAKMHLYHWPGNVRELENVMHRSVLVAAGAQIDADAIILPIATAAGSTASAPRSGGGNGGGMAASYGAMGAAAALSSTKADPLRPVERSEMVGRTVASVEKELILDTLQHCLGNRTHAANILGISIRTLRNKLKQYSETEHEKSA